MVEHDSDDGSCCCLRLTYKQAVRDFKIKFLRDALAEAGGNKARMAQTIGMNRTAAIRLLKTLGFHTKPTKRGQWCD